MRGLCRRIDLLAAGWARCAPRLLDYPASKCGDLVDPEIALRADEEVGTRHANYRAAGDRQPSGFNFLCSEAPARKRKPVAGARGPHDAHRIIKRCAASLFSEKGALIRRTAEPGAPRLALLVQQPVAAQVRVAADGPVLVQKLWRAPGHDPVIEELLAVQLRPVTAAEADRRLHIGVSKINESVRGVDAHVKLRVARV